MDIDPRLAGPRAGPFATGVSVSVASPTTATPAHPLGIGGGGGGRPLGFSPAPHQLTPIQSAPPVFTSSSPLTVAGSAAGLADQKRPRACESCRGLKVRCEPNESNPFATCKRCAKANRECIFTAPSRKRQKKSDSKVAELEKKIDALTASLNATRAQQARGGVDDDEEEYAEDEDTPGTIDTEISPIPRPIKRRRSEDTHPPGDGSIKGDSVLGMYPFLVPNESKIPTTSHPRPTDGDAHKYVYVDVVDRQLLSMEMATVIFNHYIEDMVPHFPAVVFPPGTTAEDLRREKPTLFLAILAAASGTSHPDLHRALYKEISRVFAERVMFNGEKSLELVQALILCTMWYFVPDHFQELKFYMYIHQAAVMALDIGITKKQKVARGSLRGLPPLPVQKRSSVTSLREGGVASDEEAEKGGQESAPDNDAGDKYPPPPPLPPIPPILKIPFPDSGAIESRRTLLSCYWTCCNVSMALRRPNLLRYTAFMDECIEVLESSPEAAETDKLLCQWVKLQKIAEEIGIGFAFDDPNANVSIDDQRVQFTLKGFGKQLEEWKMKCPRDIWQRMGSIILWLQSKTNGVSNPGAQSLELAYHLIMIYAHEIALHRDHNVDDFQPPYTESMMREPSLRPNELLSSCHLDAISRCLSSSHKVIETFMSMSIQAIRSVPVFTFVRTSYACVILIKLYFSASHPQSELGKVIDKNSLKVGKYMDGLLDTLKKAAGGEGEGSRQAHKFTMILMMLRHWYSKQKAEIERGCAESIPEPTFKRLELTESNLGGYPHANSNDNGNSLMEGMGTPRSMDDISPVDTREIDRSHHDNMRPPPPPPRAPSLGAATPLHMLSDAALESPRSGQYASTPSPAPNIATPRSAPAAYGKWTPDGGMYAMGHGDGPGVPVMGGSIVQGGHMGYDLGGSIEGHGGGAAYEGGMDYTPQYTFTGNGEMFMDDTFWAMIDEPMNMFNLRGNY